jgi:hypothetical protein
VQIDFRATERGNRLLTPFLLLNKRFSSFPPEERDSIIRGALAGNPDLYRLYTGGEEPPASRPTYP